MEKGTNGQERISQPTVVATETPILEMDGLHFKDLNGNGRLDPYEDWRRPVEERVDDLLSQMTLEEKSGLMVHPALAMEEGGGDRLPDRLASWA